VDDCKNFLSSSEHWANRAAGLGWDAMALFGCAPKRPLHGPYTHVPYHERIDNGFVNFVNNDHCLLSARATLHLSQWLPPTAAGLPMAQTIWYIPTGLDIWNQKINELGT